MTVMFDTNVIISAVIFKNSKLSNLVINISERYRITISTAIIEELRRVINIKWPDKKDSLEKFLCNLSYELIYTPEILDEKIYPKIRDKKDYPILASAIIGEVYVFITGDKDFNNVNIEHLEILSLTEFENKYL